MFTFQPLTKRPNRFIAKKIERKPCCFTVKVLSSGPLEHVPILNEFVCPVPSLDSLLNLFVEEGDFT